eukprot:scaffold12002_cov117-Cylindrotheca_fusiformis.AAC.2
MLATSYPVFVQQQSGVIQEARKQVLSDARSTFCTFVRSQQQDDEAAQQLIMMFGEPCKHICLKLTDDMIPAAV